MIEKICHLFLRNKEFAKFIYGDLTSKKFKNYYDFGCADWFLTLGLL